MYFFSLLKLPKSFKEYQSYTLNTMYCMFGYSISTIVLIAILPFLRDIQTLFIAHPLVMGYNNTKGY
jgi:hypothetical protein